MKMAASSLVGLIAITVPNPDVPPFFTITGCRFGLPRPILFTQAIACLLPFGIRWIGFCASLHRRDQFSGNRFPIHFFMAKIGLAKAHHVLCGRAQSAGSVPGEDRPARRILACTAMSLCQALLLFRRRP